MTSIYLPQSIFSNILTFCDDRVERRQKMLHINLIENINCYTNFEYDKNYEVDELLQHTSCFDNYYKSSNLHLSWINQDFRVGKVERVRRILVFS